MGFALVLNAMMLFVLYVFVGIYFSVSSAGASVLFIMDLVDDDHDIDRSLGDHLMYDIHSNKVRVLLHFAVAPAHHPDK